MIDDQWAFLIDAAKLINYINVWGWSASGGELWRTKEQQKIYVKKGLSQTMNSKHLDKLAIDLNFFDKGKLIECPASIGKYWCDLNPKNEWGGNWKSFKDSGHFQRNA